MNNSKDIALLVIDVQKGLFEKSIPIYNADKLLENINLLIQEARNAHVPVFFIQHASDNILKEGSEAWHFHPKIQPLDSDLIVHKRHGNAFQDTTLKDELDKRHIQRLVVTGLVSHGCVQATCIGARELGYPVILVKDAHSNYHRKPQAVIDKVHQELSQEKVELKNTQEIDFSK